VEARALKSFTRQLLCCHQSQSFERIATSEVAWSRTLTVNSSEVSFAVKYWEIIIKNLRNARWNCGCISSTDHNGRQFWVVAAERGDAGRFIVRADEKLTAFLELEAGAVRPLSAGTAVPLHPTP
jgi:hypothetical protein